MDPEAVHKRPYHLFLSHSSRDKSAVVNQIADWFANSASIPVWYDQDSLPTGARFSSYLAESIVKSRAMMIVLSKSSVASGWVEEEWGLALDHQKRFPQFRILPVVIDECTVPGFLASRTHYKLTDAGPDFAFYDAMLEGLYGGQGEFRGLADRDIYVSRTWHPGGAATADRVCRAFAEAGFRLIGDAEDQSRFVSDQQRIRSIMSSTGGLLAILPYRVEDEVHHTSKYVLREVQMAKELGIPYLLAPEDNVRVPDDLTADAIHRCDARELLADAAHASTAIDIMRESWLKNHRQHYIFFASNFQDSRRNDRLRHMMQRVTGMRCISGDDIVASSRSVQQEIVKKVSEAYVVIADISGSNVNTLIEVGIARGADVPFYLLAEEPRQRPAFMLRDTQVFYYRDAADLLGQAHRLVYPHRRRVMNAEF